MDVGQWQKRWSDAFSTNGIVAARVQILLDAEAEHGASTRRQDPRPVSRKVADSEMDRRQAPLPAMRLSIETQNQTIAADDA